MESDGYGPGFLDAPSFSKRHVSDLMQPLMNPENA